MIEQNKAAIREEVVALMQLMASRNRAELERKSNSLILSLENETDDELRGLYLFVKGITFYFQNNYQESRASFEKILQGETKNRNLRGLAHMGLGFASRSAGNLDEAVTNMVTATGWIDKKGFFRDFHVYCNQQLGEIHTTIHEYEAAITYFDNALNAAVTPEHRATAQLRHHLGLGGCYLNMKDYQKSEFHLKEALDIKDQPPLIVSRIENDLGTLYLETGEYDKAEPLLSSSLSIREAGGLEDAACTSMTALAEVYLKQNKISESVELLTRCLVLVDKYRTKRKKIAVLSLMAQAYCLTGNYELAATYYEQHNALYNEIKGEQERNIFKFKNQLIENQKKIISDKHDQLSATLEEIKRLKVNRKSIYFSWVTIIVLVIFSELFLDPFIENYAYNNILSLLVKVMIALLFKPIDGMYEKILWNRTLRKAG